METAEITSITVQATVKAPAEKVWEFWTEPRHITQWNYASPEWHTPRAENDVREGGKFVWRMEARDGSIGFDFSGTYTNVQKPEKLESILDDGRNVQVLFSGKGNETTVTETFEADQTAPLDMQKMGWQAILDNFKKHTEATVQKNALLFETTISAPAQKVYQTMLDEKGYQDWTAAFSPSSHFKGSWEKGAKIHFIGLDENGVEGGMVSRIKENIPNKFVSIEHLGLIQNGEEITSGPEVESWAGAQENYTFTEENGQTLLSIYLDANEEFKGYFSETWPKALDKLKAMCEA